MVEYVVHIESFRTIVLKNMSGCSVGKKRRFVKELSRFASALQVSASYSNCTCQGKITVHQWFD